MILLTNGCSHKPTLQKPGTEWCHQIHKKLKINHYSWMGLHDDFFFNNRQTYFNSVEELPQKDFTYYYQGKSYINNRNNRRIKKRKMVI